MQYYSFFSVFVQNFFLFYIDHSNFTNLTRQRSCYICWQAVYSKCQSHATTCCEKIATFSSIENRSAKPTCQTVNALKISSLSSKEVRFYLVKKGTKAHDHRSSAALWEIFELRKLLLLKAPPQ